MSVDSVIYDVTSGKFQLLLLSIPINITQFDYIRDFLKKLLNLSDATKILQSDDINGNFYKSDLTTEILPGISLPNDIWLRSNIIIKDIKIKITMLTEINSLIEKELNSLNRSMDETVFLYYQKILIAYKLYESPVRNSFNSINLNDYSLKEEIDENDENDDNKLLNRTVSNQSSTLSQKTHHSYFSHNSNGNNLQSPQSTNFNFNSTNYQKKSNSRENLLSRKRFSSLMGNHHKNHGQNNQAQNGTHGTNHNGSYHNGSNQNGSYHNGSNPQTPNTQTFPNGLFNRRNSSGSFGEVELENDINEDENKKQALNVLLSKSRIYNRIKKNRELSSSMNSNLSNSNRNSISTTTTTSSNNSKIKRNSSITTNEINDLKYGTISTPIFINYSLNQRQEFQKHKFEYFIQIKQLLSLIDNILINLNDNDKDSKNFKLIDFIKRYVFKFIVLDTSDMINLYGEIEAFRLYNRY